MVLLTHLNYYVSTYRKPSYNVVSYNVVSLMRRHNSQNAYRETR